MTYPLARLVSAPDPLATVRYDFNDADALAGRGVHADGFSLGAPSLLSAPDAVSPMYGDRTLSFRHEIKGSRADALAALAVLSRELLRPSNWFLFQLGGLDTRPTFWRLRATGPEALSLDRWYLDVASGDPEPRTVNSNAFDMTVNLTAEAFGYGERITLGPYTVAQDSTGTNPLRIDLPIIKGDAPAQLRLAVQPPVTDLSQHWAGPLSTWRLSVFSGTPDTDLVTTVVDDWDDVSHVSSSDYYGGKYAQIDIPAAADNVDPQITVNLPDLPAGRYATLLRCTVPAGNDQTLLFGIRQFLETGIAFAVGPYVDHPLVPVRTTSDDEDRVFWVDLGQIQLPFGLSPPSDSGVTVGATGLQVLIGSADSGAAEIRCDALTLMPLESGEAVSAETLAATFNGLPMAPVGTFDGMTETYWGHDGLHYRASQPTIEGGFPTADPTAERNVLSIIATDSGEGHPLISEPYITDRGAEVTVTASYHPRLLHLDGRP